MSSKREEEKNEKIIRGLMKLPPNRKCINCDTVGPQYVCTNFWTFVCIACSGIHREFTHRVKSVSLATFTNQEVDALKNGGNQLAKEVYLKDWDPQRMRRPNSSNPDSIRAFIKSVYIEKKYSSGNSAAKCKSVLSLQNDDERRASSYHSFSQSPPYDHQYEERRYGKQSKMLSRKYSSDRVFYGGRVSSPLYSSGSLREQIYEEKFANETGSRTSDFSVSSAGDTFRSDSQSPNFQDSVYSSPSLQQARESTAEDGQHDTLKKYSDVNIKRHTDRMSCLKETSTSGSFGYGDGNVTSLKPIKLGSFVDLGHPDSSSNTRNDVTSSPLSWQKQSISVEPTGKEASQPYMPHVAVPSVDLFADFNSQASFPAVLEPKPDVFPLSENTGWATFDLPEHNIPPFEKNIGISASDCPLDGGQSRNITMPSLHCTSQFSYANQIDHGFFQSTVDSPAVLDDAKQGHKDITSRDPNEDWFQHFTGMHTSDHLQSFYDMSGSSFVAPVRQEIAVAAQHYNAVNPFDLPFDQEPNPNDLFLDTNALQAALPNPQPPVVFLGTLPFPFFSQTPVDTYAPPAPILGDSAPVRSTQIPNVPATHVPPLAPTKGNPFA